MSEGIDGFDYWFDKAMSHYNEHNECGKDMIKKLQEAKAYYQKVKEDYASEKKAMLDRLENEIMILNAFLYIDLNGSDITGIDKNEVLALIATEKSQAKGQMGYYIRKPFGEGGSFIPISKNDETQTK